MKRSADAVQTFEDGPGTLRRNRNRSFRVLDGSRHAFKISLILSLTTTGSLRKEASPAVTRCELKSIHSS
jgi:hypothetical protein